MGEPVTSQKPEERQMQAIKNYEASYSRMWGEIGRARKERDDALKLIDVARDLVISLEHDFGDGTTKVSLKTNDAFNRLRSRLADL